MQRVEVVPRQHAVDLHGAAEQLHAQHRVDEAKQQQQRRNVAARDQTTEVVTHPGAREEPPHAPRAAVAPPTLAHTPPTWATRGTRALTHLNDDRERATTRMIMRMLCRYRTRRMIRKMRAARKAVRPESEPIIIST